MIVNVGIKRVVVRRKYHAGKDTREIFKKAGIKLEVLEDEVEKYEDQWSGFVRVLLKFNTKYPV